MTARRGLRQVLRRLRARPGDTVAVPTPRRVSPLAEIRLFAVLGAWMEADVIEACVRNAVAQGCERVLLVDNASPDDTVAVATAAGAELAVSYTTAVFEEQMRIDLMNGVVRQVSGASGLAHVWWLYLDADEFPHGPGGRTIREYLATLDARFRVVGGRYFDHFPSELPAYVPGTHPLDRMPLCRPRRGGRCGSGHAKHPLQRYDRGGPPITAGPGFHSAYASVALFEPELPIFVHHFPLREEQTTRARLEAFCRSENGARARAALQSAVEMETWGWTSHAMRRWQSLDVLYGHAPDADGRRADCAPWDAQVGVADASVRRWY